METLEAMEAEQKRQLKLGEQRAYYHREKTTDEAHARNINEGARRRYATGKAEDPEYAAKCREYAKAQYTRS